MQKTSIEWVRNTDGSQGRSANPIRARHKKTGKVGWHCVMRSPGCEKCYSAVLNKRFGTKLPYTKHSADLVDLFIDERVFRAILRLRKPQRIFLCDMTDLFMDGVSDSMLDQTFRMMAEAKQHTFQILTKRADRMAKYVGDRWGTFDGRDWPPLPNVHLGVSVENQKYADERIPLLLKTPAVMRFLSVEPLLGPVDLTAIRRAGAEGYCRPLDGRFNTIDWVIVGGESGHGARPMHPDWARSIRDQCVKSGTPYFFKQWGEWAPFVDERRFTRGGKETDSNAHLWLSREGNSGNCWLYDDDGQWTNWTGEALDASGKLGEGVVFLSRQGKEKAGRLLDGRTWDEMPKPAAVVA